MFDKRESEIMKNWKPYKNYDTVVSIRCITFNHEKYIERCLDGFLMQETTFSFEIVVHDDASNDRTAEIIRQYAEVFPHIIKPLFETENQWSKHDGSLGRVVNAALKGKYIALCEGDDYWTDCHKLQLQFEALEKNTNCSMCVCIVESCEEDGTAKEVQFPSRALGLENSCVVDGRQMISLLCPGYPFHTSSYFMTKEAYFYKNSDIQRFFKRDVGVMLRAVICGDIYYINQPMSMRRYGAPEGWNAKYRAAKDAGMFNIYCDDYLMFLMFDKETKGLYRDIVFPYMCSKLCFISVYDRSKAVELESEYEGSLGEKEYRKLLYKTIRKLPFDKQFKLITFSRAPILFETVLRLKRFFCSAFQKQ